MDIGSSLILGMTRSSQSWEVIEVQVAVDHVALAGNGVSQHITTAVITNISAVVVSYTRVCRATFIRDSAKDASDSLASLIIRGLKVLLHLLSVSGSSSLSSGGGELRTVLKSGLRDGELVTGAIALDFGALHLSDEGGVVGGGLGSVDVDGDGVGVVGHTADELVVAGVGVG